jgi:hypothetical protein
MRDCMFYVADQNMAETFKGFLTRPQFHLSLSCSPFEFDPLYDLARAEGKTDGGLWRHAGSLCKGYLHTHRRLVICLDRDFGGSPGQVQIRTDIETQLLNVGWDATNFKVLVIDPELEQWIWQNNVHVESALNHKGGQSLREMLAASGDWPTGNAKPIDPKKVLERIVTQNLRGNRSSTLYSKISSRVSVGGCQDVEFIALKQQLQTWFPVGGAA